MVSDISHIRVRSPPLRGWIFEVEVPTRVYVFQAATSGEMENWTKMIYSLVGDHPFTSAQVLRSSEMTPVTQNDCIVPPIVPEIVQRGLIKQGLLNKLVGAFLSFRVRGGPERYLTWRGQGEVHKKWRTRYFELINFPDYQLIYSLADESRLQRGVIGTTLRPRSHETCDSHSPGH